jgi:hypothetical protein
VFVLRRGGELGWVVGCSLRGERWDGEEEGEIEEESVDTVGIYWLLLMESPTDKFRRWFRQWLCHVTVRRSRFESLDHSFGKIVWKKSTSSHHCNFSKNYIIHQLYGRYIPTDVFCWYILTVSPTDIVCWYIPTKIEMEVCPSIKITDEKILSVISLVFIDFLVVSWVPIVWPSNGESPTQYSLTRSKTELGNRLMYSGLKLGEVKHDFNLIDNWHRIANY